MHINEGTNQSQFGDRSFSSGTDHFQFGDRSLSLLVRITLKILAWSLSLSAEAKIHQHMSAKKQTNPNPKDQYRRRVPEMWLRINKNTCITDSAGHDLLDCITDSAGHDLLDCITDPAGQDLLDCITDPAGQDLLECITDLCGTQLSSTCFLYATRRVYDSNQFSVVSMAMGAHNGI